MSEIIQIEEDDFCENCGEPWASCDCTGGEDFDEVDGDICDQCGDIWENCECTEDDFEEEIL